MTTHHPTRLRQGQRFQMAGQSYRVAYVNPSRAHCVSTARRPITIAGRTFLATRRASIDISHNSALDLLADLAHARATERNST